MFENEYRTIPGAKWQPAKEVWTNEVKYFIPTSIVELFNLIISTITIRIQAKQKVPSKDEVVLPKGWVWESDWKVDCDRAVDEDGWEYTLQTGYVPVEKNYHLERRRRWVRRRRLKDASAANKKVSRRIDDDFTKFWNN